MVLKKPYGFLIKHFKVIHLILTALYIYLAMHVNQILNYYNNFISNTASKLDAIKYINGLDFILNCNKYINLNYNELKGEIQELVNQNNDILNTYSLLSIEEKKKQSNLRIDYYNNEYMIDSIFTIYQIQEQQIKLNVKDKNIKKLILS